MKNCDIGLAHCRSFPGFEMMELAYRIACYSQIAVVCESYDGSVIETIVDGAWRHRRTFNFEAHFCA